MSLTTPRSQLDHPLAAPPLVTPAAVADAGDVRPAWRGGFEVGAASRWGSYHPENEDSYLMPEDMRSPFAVADGVGGGAQGKVASRVLTERIRLLTPALMADPAQLRHWLLAADDAIAAEIARGADRAGASTFVAAVPSWGGRRWAFTWAGDCRAYRLTAGNDLQCLTRDDTYRNLAESPPAGAGPDDPARMVGNGAVDQANLGATALAEGEILFLCSDGVHRFVPGDQLVSILRAGGSLEQCCRRLAAAAHRNGGNDDATVVAVERHRWFGVSHAPGWLAVFALMVAVALLAWQYFPHAGPARPEPVPSTPPDPTPAPAPAAVPPAPAPAAVPPAPAPAAAPPAPAPAAAPPAPAPASALPTIPAGDGLRLTPSRSISGGLQPADVAAPIKQPPAPRHKTAQPHLAQGARPARNPASAQPAVAPPAGENASEAASASSGARRTDNPGTEKKPEPPPATENQQ
jgi:serine/threonine protein phosphatase PrpC